MSVKRIICFTMQTSKRGQTEKQGERHGNMENATDHCKPQEHTRFSCGIHSRRNVSETCDIFTELGVLNEVVDCERAGDRRDGPCTHSLGK